MARRPTLNDVVAETGLSIFTVSRALRGAQGVSEASRTKVLAAARKIGYVPNGAARALRNQTPGPVIVMKASSSNAYYVDMITGIQVGLRSAGMGMRTADIAPDGVFDADLENAAVQEAMQSRASGVISTLTLQPENYRRLTEWGVPVVFVDSHPPASELGTASVTTDNAAATAAVGEHLASHGQSDWVLLIYPHLWSTRAAREAGLRRSAEQHGARLTVVESANDPVSAQQAMSRYLDSRTAEGPFALIAGNNPLLRGGLSAVREAGMRLPQDVSLISFDEFMWAPLIDPPITVVDEDSRHIGEIAAATLRDIVQRKNKSGDASGGSGSGVTYHPEDTKEVTATLLVRQSCGCN
ncbi:LacI family DNA-binding transcriptional regulator [Propioniciclava sp. MC1683]|uniref:LacI family DNA-binding transcriptional regulator n=1 Tax=Propioniciclava sp. MC1683 TaxID=2760309 RepID=UPI0016023695|nr:LacI family DNA-binding transcriptional regulator [Propioniciclava sp. MC1683]MBB1503055.1 LacI family DNA-binding transcriptional regulator [Propioniciclava sp. MC1683]